MFGPELIQAFSRIQSHWDPEWRMNPASWGAVPDDENLKVHPESECGNRHAFSIS